MKFKVYLFILLSIFSTGTKANQTKSLKGKLSKKAVTSIIEKDELIQSALETNESSIEEFIKKTFFNLKTIKQVQNTLKSKAFRNELLQEIEISKDVLVTDEPDFEYVEVIEEDTSCYQCVG